MRSILVFFTLSLVDARRMSNNDDTVATDTEDYEWGRLCPPGLNANATAETCTYHGKMIGDPEEFSTVAWARGSDHPLVFTPWGGIQNIEEDLLRELQYMMRHEEYVHALVHLVHVHHTQSERGVIATVHGAVETLESSSENLSPLEFVAEHAVEHLVITGLEVGLEVLVSAASTGGLGVATIALEGSLEAVELVGLVLTSELVLAVSAVHTAYMLGRHWHTKDSRAREFSVALVAKSDCIISKISLHHEQIFDDNSQFLDPNFFIPEIQEVCGADIEAQLGQQMIKTNEAMISLFEEFKGIGKCLYPEGSRSWSKSNCVAAVYENLRSHEGQPGILYSAFSISAAYGQESDEILGNKVYSQWFEQYFNITMPNSQDTREELHNLKERQAPLGDRASACISIVGLHRAFERTFIRLKTALNIFMHSFARETLHLSMRTTQHPCRRIFRKLEDMDGGLCKEGLDRPLTTPDTRWLRHRIASLEDSDMEDDVETCLEDTHPELHISIFADGPEHGENEEEEREHEEE